MSTVQIEVNVNDAPALEAILHQLNHARKKHSESYAEMSWFRKGSYLTEESLEAIQAINDRDIDNAKIEIAQVAAVCIRILCNR